MASPCESAMIFFKYFLAFLGAKLAYSAGCPQTIDQKSAKDNVPVINSFSSDLWVEIGRYLPFPQQELGFLNKTASHAVFKLFPYRRLVKNRFGIHELLNVDNDKDMAWFKNLAFAKDPVEMFLSICAGLFDQKAFPNINVPISRFIVRTFRSLPAEVASTFNPGQSLLVYFISNLFQVEGFAEIIEIYKLFPPVISKSIHLCGLEKTTKLIKQIFTVSKENDTELFDESIATFKLILGNITCVEQRTKYLYCCILANIPLNIYIDEFLNYFHEILQIPCYERQRKLSVEESQRIYETFLVILDRFRAKNLETENIDQEILIKIEEAYESYKILLKIGFKLEVEENIYELEIKKENFDKQMLTNFAYYALFAGRIELFKEIFNDERLGKVEDVSCITRNQYNFADFAYALHAYELIPVEKRKILLSNLAFFGRFRFIYDAVKIEYDGEGILIINFKRVSTEYCCPLPDTFEYVHDTKIGSLITAYKILEVIVFSNTTLETEAFIEFFQSIVNCPYFTEALALTQSKPLDVTMNIIKRFSQSEELCILARESGLRIRFDYRNMAAMFRENIVGANFVAFEGELFEFLPMLTTRTQIRNFENFMGKNIADIFFIDALPAIKQEDLITYYYKYRTILHHLLNGPHKHRLLELDIPFFRRMLAKEVQEIDAIFLTEGLEPETDALQAGQVVNAEEPAIEEVLQNVEALENPQA